MIESRIVMPIAARVAGNLAAHDALRLRLIEVFGGYTCTSGTGGWMDGVPTTESVAVYDVAHDDTIELRTALSDIAVEFGDKLGQKAVYVRIGGEAEIIDLKPVKLPKPSEVPPHRQPQPGEVWNMRCGGKAAVIGQQATCSHPLRCVVLDRGSNDTAANPGDMFQTDLRGRYATGTTGFDLTSYSSRF